MFLEKGFVEICKILENINSNDYELRINFLYELARMNNRPK